MINDFFFFCILRLSFSCAANSGRYLASYRSLYTRTHYCIKRFGCWACVFVSDAVDWWKFNTHTLSVWQSDVSDAWD